jgi:putative transcriptional regulator
MYSMERLKELRKKNKYTIYDMAKKLKITPSFYSQIENKKRRLFYDTALKISAIFNMKPDEIFYTKNC